MVELDCIPEPVLKSSTFRKALVFKQAGNRRPAKSVLSHYVHEGVPSARDPVTPQVWEHRALAVEQKSGKYRFALN